jgi:hypothetical protein
VTSLSLSELLVQIRARIAAASPGPWRVERENGIAFIRTGQLQGEDRIYLKRDGAPADDKDVTFVAVARNSLPALADALESNNPHSIAESEIEELQALVDSATPEPWTPHTEDSGPIGGSSVIWVDGTNDVPDLYVLAGDQIASSADYEFIAHSRQDVPRLVSELRTRR